MPDDEASEHQHVDRTDDELRQIAEDIHKGKVFTDRHLTDARDLPMVFMIIGLLPPDDLLKQAEVVGDKGAVFEYLDKASPRSINGMPMFMSMQILSDAEGRKVWPMVIEMNKAVAEVGTKP